MTMQYNDRTLTIVYLTAAYLRGSVPTTGALEERLRAAMRKVREPGAAWLCENDDQMFRSAIAIVLADVNPEERARLARSFDAVKSLSAAVSGVPVDFTQINADDIIPLLGLWHDTAPGATR